MSWLSRLFGTRPPDPAVEVTHLVVGLGNPGAEYEGTRHNVGFEAVDRLAARLGVTLGPGGVEAARSWVAEAAVPPDAASGTAGLGLALARPLTFMNRSGEAVAALLDRYGLGPDRVLVVYDDLALPVGAVRLRGKGSHGGHNGVRSVIEHLGSSEFPRMRLGVGDSFPPGGQVDFVLSPFDADERPALDAALRDASEAALTFAREGLALAQTRHNRR